MGEVISSKRFTEIVSSALFAEEHSVVMGRNYLVVDLELSNPPPQPVFWPNCVIIGMTQGEGLRQQLGQCPADVVSTNSDTLDILTNAIDAHPLAAATLVQVLRHNANASVQQGLLAESLAYSTLQQSADFQAWLDTRVTKPAPAEDATPLIVTRTTTDNGDRLTLTLNRPAVHNAYNSALKDSLCAALVTAQMDPTITQVHLNGAGASFSAGGDLSEFGSVTDAGLAHLSRTTRNAANLLANLTAATSSEVHGACIGAGIELPAFTQHVTAAENTFFQLPEVAMGLIPGAGGTVSVLRRIGRQRTAWLALSNQAIDASTALQWGLVDALSA